MMIDPWMKEKESIRNGYTMLVEERKKRRAHKSEYVARTVGEMGFTFSPQKIEEIFQLLELNEPVDVDFGLFYEITLREYAILHYDAMLSSFGVIEKVGLFQDANLLLKNGYVPLEDLKTILLDVEHEFAISEEEFESLINDLHVGPSGFLNYRPLLDKLSELYRDEQITFRAFSINSSSHLIVRPLDTSEESVSEGYKRQGFDFGGCKHSGQQLLDPLGQRPTPQKLAERFRAARANDADVVSPGEEAVASSKKPKPKGGHGLGMGGEPSNAPQEEVVLGDDEDTVPQRIVLLHIWQNGFSVNDGPLRDPRKPQNDKFLQAIAAGRVPAEIYRMFPRERIEIELIMKGTDYLLLTGSLFRGPHRYSEAVGAGLSTSSSQHIPVVTSAAVTKTVEGMSDKKAIVFGATGAVGRRLVDALVNSREYTRILLLGRREFDLGEDNDYSKVEQKVIDFEKLDETAGSLVERADAVFCSLGTTRAEVEADGFLYYKHIMETARVAKARNVTKYLLVSSVGASPNAFLRYFKTKGEVERDIASLDFEHLTIARPAMLEGPREEHRSLEGVAKVLIAPIKLICHDRIAISTEAVAKALVVSATSKDAPSGKAIVDNRKLWRLSKEFDKRFAAH